MNGLFEHKDLAGFLRAEIDRRSRRNHQYSLRAFARDSKINPTSLSFAINNKSSLSSTSVNSLSIFLGLSAEEKSYLHLLAMAQKGSTKARNTLTILSSIEKVRHVISSNFESLLEVWYRIPLIEALSLPEPWSIKKLSATFDASEKEIAAQIQILKTNNLLTVSENCFKKSHAFTKVESKNSQKLIRNFHRVFLKIASEAIETQAIPQKKYLTTVLQIKKEDIESARNEIEQFNAKFLEKYGNDKKADAIYVLSNQLYEIGTS